jgi:tetratricopeptide (TPR) repeat protein
MNKAFELWSQDQSEEALNLFERIANAEPDNWVPHYYVAQMNILKSWGLKDQDQLKAQLDKAQEHVNTAMGLSPDNAELLILQAQIYTNWIAYDGMTYGMKYSGKVSELYNKAQSLDPNNPRVVLSKAEWDMGSARYFGQDPTPHCDKVKDAIKLFETYEVAGAFYPDWGRDHAKNVMASCNQ